MVKIQPPPSGHRREISSVSQPERNLPPSPSQARTAKQVRDTFERVPRPARAHEQELRRLFAAKGISVPEAEPQKLAELRQKPGFQEAEKKLKSALDKPDLDRDAFHQLKEYMDQYPHGDVMASLFYVFRDSIEESNEDKRYYLTRLKGPVGGDDRLARYASALDILKPNPDDD